jgi:hypothetical protein
MRIQRLGICPGHIVSLMTSDPFYNQRIFQSSLIRRPKYFKNAAIGYSGILDLRTSHSTSKGTGIHSFTSALRLRQVLLPVTRRNLIRDHPNGILNESPAKGKKSVKNHLVISSSTLTNPLQSTPPILSQDVLLTSVVPRRREQKIWKYLQDQHSVIFVINLLVKAGHGQSKIQIRCQ